MVVAVSVAAAAAADVAATALENWELDCGTCPGAPKTNSCSDHAGMPLPPSSRDHTLQGTVAAGQNGSFSQKCALGSVSGSKEMQ